MSERSSMSELSLRVLPLLSGHIQASSKHIEENALDQASSIKRILKELEVLPSIDSQADLIDTTTRIHKEAGTLLYSLQYQDRVNQILQNIAVNLNKLVHTLDTDEPIDVDKWLREMKHSYTTIEQHVQHLDVEDNETHASSGDINFL